MWPAAGVGQPEGGSSPQVHGEQHVLDPRAYTEPKIQNVGQTVCLSVFIGYTNKKTAVSFDLLREDM